MAIDFLIAIVVFVVCIILGSIKQINQYERGIKFTLGKFTKIMQPQRNNKIPLKGKLQDPPGFDLLFQLRRAPADAVPAEPVQQGMELRAMVEVAQVAELVEQDIVPQRFLETHQVEIEVDIALGGTAAPVGDIVLDEDLPEGEAIPLRPVLQAAGQEGLRLLPERFRIEAFPFRRERLGRGGLPGQHLGDPVPLLPEKADSERIRGPIGHGHDDPAHGMDTEGDTARPPGLDHPHGAEFGILVQFFHRQNSGIASATTKLLPPM